MNEQYVFDSGLGQPALDEINADPTFPITGRNAGTGELEPDKQKTVRWCDSVKVRVTDGKEYFPRLPNEHLKEVDPDKILNWLETYLPTIEVFDPSWRLEPEDIL